MTHNSVNASSGFKVFVAFFLISISPILALLIAMIFSVAPQDAVRCMMVTGALVALARAALALMATASSAGAKRLECLHKWLTGPDAASIDKLLEFGLISSAFVAAWAGFSS
ncbi:hypothetical protein [Dongia sp.]|uniref:hypothetical protein n=1 Tax=Dongia sp. TaxID=1977262 RepID=UPI0035B2DE3E